MSILIEPIISEKAMRDAEIGKYVFRIKREANKAEIAKAIEKLYKVNCVKVNCVNVRGEEKLIRGRFRAKTKPYKKAIVTLKKGQKIPEFIEK